MAPAVRRTAYDDKEGVYLCREHYLEVQADKCMVSGCSRKWGTMFTPRNMDMDHYKAINDNYPDTDQMAWADKIRWESLLTCSFHYRRLYYMHETDWGYRMVNGKIQRYAKDSLYPKD